MTDEENRISESTSRYSEIVPPRGQNKILSLTNKVVDGDLIDLFDVIPDAIEQPRLPFAITVPIGERHTCLAGGHLVNRGVPVQCIAIEAEDTSRPALALLKVSLWMTGILLGSLSYMEQARDMRILYNLHIADAGIIINGNGGDRRSEAFKEQEGEHIRQFLARSLDRSEHTIRIYLDHTRYLNIDMMNELVLKRVPKSSIVGACKLRTEFISGLSENLTEDEITAEVSEHFFKWVSIYDSTKSQVIPKVDGQDTETGKNDGQNDAGDTMQDGAVDVSLNNSTGDKPGKAVAAQVGQTKTSSPASEAVSPETDGNQPKANDAVKEKTDIKDPDETEADPEEEAAKNDINIGGKPKLPDVKLGNTPVTPVKDVYQQLEEIGNNLVGISKEKPLQQQLSQQVGDVIRTLMKLFPGTQNMNGGSLPQTTLMGGA
jgi:hypothetical protein